MKKITEQKISFSFRLPESLNQQMNESIVKEGRGLKGKSAWIREAVENFLALTNYAELVSLSEDKEKSLKSVTISMRLPRNLMLAVEQAIIDVRRTYPALEGVKSKIIKSSIYQRVLGNFKNSGDRKMI